MRSIFLVLCTFSFLSATQIILKNDTVYEGDVICQKKGSITLKSEGGTLTILKKSIKSIDSVNYEGARSITIADSLILKNKNELAFINESTDSATIRLRNKIDSSSVGEMTGGPGDTLLFLVPNGEYFETVEYLRGEITYYTKGNSFIISSSCKSYMRQLITIMGYPGTNVPRLKSMKDLFERP